MLLSIIAPLLFSSALFQIDLTPPVPVETQQVHKNSNNPTILSSEYNAELGANCVSFVRSMRPDAPAINASEYPVATTTPFIGAIGKEYYPKKGLWHVFIVVDIVGDYLIIQEGNYVKYQITTRVVRKDRIVGYL